ncbi:hypothetical protein DV737_g1294, partial [Chaetothyriales sp. CBS 132003]
MGRLGSSSGLPIPDRDSSLKRPPPSQHISSQVAQPLINQATSLIHAYMVCGLSRNPTDWSFCPQPAGPIQQRAHRALGSSISPTILGSIPPHDQDVQTAHLFSCALKHAFPNDAELVCGHKPPESMCHPFVLQSQSSNTFYGVALRLWVKIDPKRQAKILEVLSPEAAEIVNSETATWMPYCLSYLSHYPLFDLMSDYLRYTWMLFGKQPDKFNNEGVLRLTQMPPPQAEQLLRIDVENYTFCYKLPADPTRFQNFALWPLFCCLTPQQIVAVIEAALSPQGRIIFTSQHPAVLTNVAESVRFYVKTWAGLYVPLVYGRQAQEHIDEPAPYILGVTKQTRSLFTAPNDALLVDLDFQRIFTSRPPGSLSPRLRKRYAKLLGKALGPVETGVPKHLKSAYDNSKFLAFGAVVSSGRAVSAVKDPVWWYPAQVQAAMGHIAKRVRQNYKLLAALDSVKRHSTKISTQELADLVHDRNYLSRSVDDAWMSYIKVKQRSEGKIMELMQRESSLETDLYNSKKEYSELCECTEALIEDSRKLQSRINQQMRDNVAIAGQLRDKTLHAKQLSNHVSELQSELKEANKALTLQQELIEETEWSRDTSLTTNSEFGERYILLAQERDEAHRAIIHLTSLISGQITYIERVISSLLWDQSRPAAVGRRSFPGNSLSSIGLPASASQSPSFKPGDEDGLELKRHTDDFPLGVLIAGHGGQLRIGSPLGQFELPEEGASVKEKVGAVAATVRRINEQCKAAVQDLADRRAETQAARPRASSPAPPAGKKAVGSSLRASSVPSMMPSAISKLIERSRRERRDGDNMSMTSSEISKFTQLTSANTIISSVPSLVSFAPTVTTDATGDRAKTPVYDGPHSQYPTAGSKLSPASGAMIQIRTRPIKPAAEDAAGGSKECFRRSSTVLGRSLFS